MKFVLTDKKNNSQSCIFLFQSFQKLFEIKNLKTRLYICKKQVLGSFSFFNCTTLYKCSQIFFNKPKPYFSWGEPLSLINKYESLKTQEKSRTFGTPCIYSPDVCVVEFQIYRFLNSLIIQNIVYNGKTILPTLTDFKIDP